MIIHRLRSRLRHVLPNADGCRRTIDDGYENMDSAGMRIGVGAFSLRKTRAKANSGPATIHYGTLKVNDAGSIPGVPARPFDVATDNLHDSGVTNDNS